VSGCAINAERNNPGGFTDSLMDKVFPANSKQMRLLRAYLIQAALVRLQNFSSVPSSKRAVFVTYVANANGRFEDVYRCVYNTTGKSCFYFDSLMIDYENVLFDMAMLNLSSSEKADLMPYAGVTSTFLYSDRPAQAIRSFVGGLAGSVTTLDPFDVIDYLLDLSRKAYVAQRPFGAVYRDIHDYMGSKRIGIEQQVEPEVNSPADFIEIYGMIQSFCRYIGVNDDGIRDCQKRPAVLSNPAAMLALDWAVPDKSRKTGE
jgi:hypothetical protein